MITFLFRWKSVGRFVPIMIWCREFLFKCLIQTYVGLLFSWHLVCLLLYKVIYKMSSKASPYPSLPWYRIPISLPPSWSLLSRSARWASWQFGPPVWNRSTVWQSTTLMWLRAWLTEVEEVVSAWCSRLATGRIASTRLRTEVSHSGDGSSVRGVMDRGKHLAFYLFCLLSVTKENRAATTGFT